MKNISGTIASGGAAQVLFDPQGQTYHGYWIRNNNASSSLYISDQGTAVINIPSLEIKPGELYETPPNIGVLNETLSIISATTSHSFMGRVW